MVSVLKQGSLKEQIYHSKGLKFANQELHIVGGIEAKLKASDMERQAFSAVVELLEISGSFELEDVLQHRATKESLSIFNVKRTLRNC